MHDEAKKAGADHAGLDDLIAKVKMVGLILMSLFLLLMR